MPSFRSRAARLLLITSAMMTNALLSLERAAAKSGYQTMTSPAIPADAHMTIQGTKKIIAPLAIDTLSLEADSTVIVNSFLTVKHISCDAANATMVLCPNAIVDLGGSTLTASSYKLADGAIALCFKRNFTDENVLLLSNGANLMNGIFILDMNQSNALHFLESNEDNNQETGVITLRDKK